MVNVIKQEVRMEESLRNRLEFICEFCKVKSTIINGNLRTIDKTNLTYLEPHRIIINGITFLAFNYSNEIFIENLNNKIKLNRRIEEVYEKIPLIKDLDGQIGVLAGRALRLSLSGNSSAKDTLREDIALISEQKKAALLAGGYSADYLDEIFTCPKCKDTGFIDGKPCECLKAEVVRLL